MMPIFTEQYDAQEFLLCLLLCAIYYITAVSATYKLLRHYIGNLQSIALLNLYSLFMSLPLMPFVAGFSALSMALFSLSNFIWQRIKLTAEDKDFKKFVVLLSICHMTAWIALSLFHYWFSDDIMNFLLPENAWIE